MTVVRLGLAFLAVGALFVGFAWLAAGKERGNAVTAAAEALLLTLLGALWFSSLGHGSWVLVFLLIGLMVSVAGHPVGTGAGAGWFRVTALTALRYLAAGAILALLIG